MPQLICRNLTLGYEGKTVVYGLSFAVNAGDYLCVVGENGAGKSTLMKTLLRLHMPVTGDIETDDGLARCDIGYQPQQTSVQKDFPASVQEVVRSGCLNRIGLRPFYSRSEKQAATDSMQQLGIAHLAKRCYRELSGGQQRRVLLARALCAARKMLVLDEPASGLDPDAAADMYALVRRLNEMGITIIMVSHDISASIAEATHILRLNVASPPFFGTKMEYLEHEGIRG